MTKEEFIALGVSEELAEACAAASAHELEGFVSKRELEIAQQAKETLELQVKENAKQLNILKKSAGDTEKLTQTIAELQDSNKKAKADYEAQLKDLRIGYAVDSALTNAKARNVKAVKALLDMDALEIGENGKVKGLSSQIKKLTESDDTAFLFDTANRPDPKDGKPRVKDAGGSDENGNKGGDEGGKKSSIGATFAKAYNSLFAPANGGSDNGGKGE